MPCDDYLPDLSKPQEAIYVFALPAVLLAEIDGLLSPLKKIKMSLLTLLPVHRPYANTKLYGQAPVQLPDSAPF